MSQFPVMPAAIDRVFLHIFERVVHPAHVPFEGEAEAVFFHVCGNAPFCRRIFRDQIAGGLAADLIVQLAHEIHAFEVHPAAEHVGTPFFAVIVVIKHGSDCIHAQRVDMEFVDPIEGVGDQERADFRLAVVEGHRAPNREFRTKRVAVFIKAGAVKIPQRPFIFAEMGGDPVKDDPDPGLMHFVDKIAEIIRRPVAGSRGIITGHLIAPGKVEGIFADPHQFHMGIAHVIHILSQVIRQLPVIQEAIFVIPIAEPFFPGAQMDFIDRHRPVIHFGVVPLCLVSIIMPGVGVQRADNGGIGRTQFSSESHRVRLPAADTIRPGHDIPIGIPIPDTREKDFPNPAVKLTAVHPLFVFPTGTRTDQGNSLSIWRPHHKFCTLNAVFGVRMGTEFTVDPIVGSLVEEETVEIRKHYLP